MWSTCGSPAFMNCPYLCISLGFTDPGDWRWVWLRSCNVSVSLYPSRLWASNWLCDSCCRLTYMCDFAQSKKNLGSVHAYAKCNFDSSWNKYILQFICTLGLIPQFCQSNSNRIEADCWSITLWLSSPNSLCFEADLPKLKSRLWSSWLPEDPGLSLNQYIIYIVVQ